MSASASTKVIIAALLGNMAISIIKFIAAFMTGSSAMLSEGIHSLVDTGNQMLLLYGIKRAKKPADEEFPFGYGKEIYFWSFVVAILIFPVGAGLSLYEGVHHVINPVRSEEHTSELQSPCNLVCRLLLEKKKTSALSYDHEIYSRPINPKLNSTSK